MIDRLFSSDVITVSGDTPQNGAPGLLPEEYSQIRRAVEKRQREYADGRRCARTAFAKLGIYGFALVNDADRVPVWPENVVGSLTHCEGYCGVAIARKHPTLGIGVDAEPINVVDTAVQELICTANELEFIRTAAESKPGYWFAAFFSAKESFYKAVFPVFRTHLDFHDVEIHMGSAGAFRPEALVPLSSGFERLSVRGKLVATDTHVFTGVTARE